MENNSTIKVVTGGKKVRKITLNKKRLGAVSGALAGAGYYIGKSIVKGEDFSVVQLMLHTVLTSWFGDFIQHDLIGVGKECIVLIDKTGKKVD
jgi:hypothetical protein